MIKKYLHKAEQENLIPPFTEQTSKFRLAIALNMESFQTYKHDHPLLSETILFLVMLPIRNFDDLNKFQNDFRNLDNIYYFLLILVT